MMFHTTLMAYSHAKLRDGLKKAPKCTRCLQASAQNQLTIKIAHSCRKRIWNFMSPMENVHLHSVEKICNGLFCVCIIIFVKKQWCWRWKIKVGEWRSQSGQQDGCLQPIKPIKGGRRKMIANQFRGNLKKFANSDSELGSWRLN